jgi:hypothetical protein
MFKKISPGSCFFSKDQVNVFISLGLSLGWAGTARGKVRHFRKWEFYAACLKRTKRVYSAGPLPAQAMFAPEKMLPFTEDRKNQDKSSRPVEFKW